MTTSNKNAGVIEFATGRRNLEALEAERDAFFANRKQSSAVPARPALSTYQEDFDVEAMIARARAEADRLRRPHAPSPADWFKGMLGAEKVKGMNQ